MILAKEISRKNEQGLKAQVMSLTRKLEVADKKFMGKINGKKLEEMQAQLNSANVEIADLRAQLNQLRALSKNTPIEEKLSQALGKIEQQDKAINLLAQKLLECGQSVDLTKELGKNTSGAQRLF